jgi:hypothetical protein
MNGMILTFMGLWNAISRDDSVRILAHGRHREGITFSAAKVEAGPLPNIMNRASVRIFSTGSEGRYRSSD